MNMPKVSVIIPVYNVEAYLRECLDSVINQTFKNIEIICVDDGSTDSSGDICEEYAKKDNRIIVIHQDNMGLSGARNTGLDTAHGEYIAYIDSDDYVEAEYIEKLVIPLSDNAEVDITCCGFTYVNDFGSRGGWMPNQAGKIEIDFDFRKFTMYVQFETVWIKMYRKQWLIDNDLYMPNCAHEDNAFHLMMSINVKNLYFIKEPLYNYREDNINSLTHIHENKYKCIDALNCAIEYCRNKNAFESQKNAFYVYSYGMLMHIGRYIDSFERYEQMVGYFVQKNFPYAFDEIINKYLKAYNKFAMYGAGLEGKNFINSVDLERVECIIDNSPNLKGTSLNGKNIISFDEFLRKYNDLPIVITSSRYFYEIAEQLVKNGIKDFCSANRYKIAEKFETKSDKRIILFNTPEHSNVGDHIIAEVEKQFLNEYIPEYNIVEVTDCTYVYNIYVLKRYIKPNDIIVVTGGGFLGSLWIDGGELLVRRIMTDFPDNKIVIFPQSMYFEDTLIGRQERNNTKAIYDICTRLTVVLREMFSYETAKELLGPHIKCELMPDIVLSKQVEQKLKVSQSKAAFCLRDDKESILSDLSKTTIKNVLQNRFASVEKIRMHAATGISVCEREGEINKKLDEIHSYDVVVTDTLHCMICCAITGIPCIAFNNISRKVEGVYKWIEKLEYVKFIDDISQLEESIVEVISADKKYDFDYKPYFEKLAKLIREE